MRQSRADLDAQIAKCKADAMTLIGIDRSKRTDTQKARLAAIDADLTRLTAEAAGVAEDLSLAEKYRDEMIAQHGTPAVTPTADAYLTAATGWRKGRGRELFGADVANDTRGFPNLNAYLEALHTNSPALYASTALRSGSAGATLAPQYFFDLMDAAAEEMPLFSRADVRAITGAEVMAPAWDDLDRSGDTFAGFAGYWTAEGGSITESTPELRLVKMAPTKLAILSSYSNELLADGVNFANQVGPKIVAALRRFLETAFLTGNGAGRPIGVINASATIEVTPESGQSANTINHANLAKMYSRLTPGSHRRAVWIVNASAIPQLMALSISIGDAGAHVPVLQESNGTFSIFGVAVVFTDLVPALGSRGDVVLVDPTAYLIGLRSTFEIARSEHAGFSRDVTYIRGTVRCAGLPKIDVPITPKYGDTQSPFVVLGAR
ncbi:MAG: phage major capsid protein [Acidobacteria bacterium]|nr:phage major capsid protein [Acidobacteriota bacterium]